MGFEEQKHKNVQFHQINANPTRRIQNMYIKYILINKIEMDLQINKKVRFILVNKFLHSVNAKKKIIIAPCRRQTYQRIVSY